MRTYNIHLQYGEHTFRRALKATSLRVALDRTMLFVNEERQMRNLHFRVSRPTKTIVKVGI